MNLKHLLLFGGALLGASGAMAQDNVTPVQLPEFYAQKVSRNGTYVVGQDGFGSLVIVYNTETEKLTQYEAYYPGNGHCVADNGMVVGQDLAGIDQHAAVMWNGKGQIPSTLKSIGQSELTAITPDGTRAVGYMTNTSSGPMYVPFYVDIEADGTFGKPQKLPFPRTDFFGNTPQYVEVTCVSDDGTTMAGFVVDSSGFFMWPIVYTLGDNNRWSYTEPSASLFNPDKLARVPDPDGSIEWGKNGAPAQPNALDFMTEEELQEYLQAKKTNPDLQPWNYMTDEEYDAYEKAIGTWGREADAYIAKLIDEYHEWQYKAGKDEQFGTFYVLSRDGKKLVAMKGTAAEEAVTDIMAYYTLIEFDLEAGTMTTLPFNAGSLIPTQMLADDTLLALSLPTAMVPYTCYMLEPEAEAFIPFTSFLEERIPQYYPWLEDTFGGFGDVGLNPDGTPVKGSYILSGWVSVSDDYKTISGGFPTEGGFSYVYYDASGTVGVDAIEAEQPVQPEGDDVYYNLQGIRVYNPGPGMYIKNNQKVIIK